MGGGRRRRMSVYSSPSQTRKWHVSAKEQKVKLAHPGPQTLISYSANFHSQRNLLSGGASKFQGGIALKKEGPKKYLGLGEISLGRCQNQASSLPYFKSPGKWLSELGLQKITEDEKCGYWSSKNTANSAQSSNFWYLCAWRLSSTFPLHPHLFSSFSRSQMRMGSVSSHGSCGKSCVGSNRSRIYFSWEYSNLLVNHP